MSGYVDDRGADRYADHYAQEPPPAPTNRYHEWLGQAERVVGRGHLLEVGAGAGGLVAAALKRGWSVTATETSGSALERLRRLGGAIVHESLTNVPASAFDLVVSLEVLEHVADPRAMLAQLHRTLRPGGLVLLSTPNFNGLTRRIFGLRWRVIHPEHLVYFTPNTLKALAQGVGFRAVAVRTRSLDITSWSLAKAPRPFDAARSATLRDHIGSSPTTSRAKDILNGLLGALGLGDSMLLWARR